MRRCAHLALGAIAAMALFAGAPRHCFAQSANKIIAQWLGASGGAKAVAKIHSASWQGTVRNTNASSDGEFTLITAAPNEFYREFTFGAGQIVEACNTSSCWREEGSGNLYTLFGAEEKREEATGRYLNFALANYKKLKIVARFAGGDAVNGRPADVIELKIPPGETRRVYFDRQSHLIVKEAVENAEESATQATGNEKTAGSVFKVANSSMGGAEEITYADYRPVEGVMEPFQISIEEGGRTFHISADRIVFNREANTSSFLFPNLSKKPLPDIPALLIAVDENQQKIDEIQKDYACMKREEEDKVDGKGEVTKRTVTVYQISYVAGHEMNRKIEVDGKPLSSAEQQKEDARLEKEADRYTKEAADPKTKKDDNEVGISDFLRTSRFTNPRWERFRGQDVVVFDFGPNPNYKPKRLVEKVIYDLVGTVWVDPQARDIARLEARLGNSVKIGGGMVASLQKGSALQFEQSLVNDQVWLPSYDEVHVGAKVLLLKSLREDVVDHYYDYQKFDVKTQQKIAPPKQP